VKQFLNSWHACKLCNTHLELCFHSSEVFLHQLHLGILLLNQIGQVCVEHARLTQLTLQLLDLLIRKKGVEQQATSRSGGCSFSAMELHW
jgi:hypothetical protein